MRVQWRLLATGAVLSAVAASGVTWQHLDVRETAAHQAQGEHEVAEASLFPRSPGGVLRAVAELTARGDALGACKLFTPAAATSFAAARESPSCAAAVAATTTRITNPALYGSYRLDTADDWQQGSQTVVDGCHLAWGSMFAPQPAPGPQIGRLTVAPRSTNGGWHITGYEACPQPSQYAQPGAPQQVPPAAPVDDTSTPGRTRPLPSWPTAYAQVMTRAIANRDTGVCQLLTPRASAEMGAAWGGKRCEDAVITMNAQVTKSLWYAVPSGARVSDEGGRTVLDGCSLRFGVGGDTSQGTAGPQLGRLTLTAASGGYVVTSYRAC